MSAQAHRAAGITGGTVRVSVDVETAEDLVDDLAQGFERL
jgi:O-acetylhomoserine/O-acetylserine sulfhydrylase-like pyridoxal-dependent enzyme